LPSTAPAASPTSQVAAAPAAASENAQAGAAEIESPDGIDEILKEAKLRPAGLFRYGPVSLIDPYWKGLNEQADRVGLKLGLTYTAVFQAASGGPGERQAAGGDVGLFGNWRFLGEANGRNNGYLYFYSENRHELFSEIPPASIAGEIGSLWKTTNGFNEEPLVMRDLYWEQHFGGDYLIVRAGKIDPHAYYNSNYWQSDSKYFMNRAFSSFPVRSFPGDGLGMNMTIRPADWVYISSGFQDAQGQKTSAGFDTFFGDFNLFSAMEVGFTPRIAGLGKGTYRFTGWYRDAGESDGRPHDAGFDLSFDQELGRHLIPFFRYGYGEGNIEKLEHLVSAGLGWQGDLFTKSDVAGFGMSWGRPSDDELRAQYAAEVFYRLQISPDNQLTVGYQMIVDPSFAPDDHVVGVFEIRWRVSL
jgi:carbohydrate-selective porin OprB